jgi:hypothetical protein
MPSTLIRKLTNAAYKASRARLRAIGMGRTHPQWAERATICETCPLRIIEKKVSYCGRPFLHDIDRDPTINGCGCPTIPKAQDLTEHCPLNRQHLPANTTSLTCDCKWCTQLRRH